MAENYVTSDYVECDYVDDCFAPEIVKTFGFSQVDKQVLKTGNAQILKNKQNDRYGRMSFVFPLQEANYDN